MLCVSAVLSAIYSLTTKRIQTHLRSKHNIHLHPTESTFFIMGYCGLVMFVLGLIIETKAWGIFFNVIFELKNWLLLSLVGGCLLTTIDKLSSIFLTMRNSIIDWAII